ncbi:MBL fold metallo-hydrolase [Pseudomaricurvus alkylphenolicus]|jgi:ribonuclease Z|uniref:MBL fold metallo-hydrolase n=1 Tax=Pseudomaricurvus alkylphenolicus TaxID=1306991 RepID=UPI00141F8AB9|nr:MBL fold metallo-hydrolase [Pseudomaricurvus alkylphenolicus]NIB42973.1 MBL fold metallo-hydrolase [Pseudomaricurvus alkylphenolicus]
MPIRIQLLFVAMGLVLCGASWAQRDFSDSDITKVVMLGTGTPNPSPFQSGCSIAIVVKDTPYIVDFGPGLIRQAARFSPRYGGDIPGLQVRKIKRAFLTHLHSDHTTGYPDLILTPWVMSRDAPLEVYGPEGLTAMTNNILEAYQEDIRYRLYGAEPANNQGWRVNSHEIREEGVIYKDDNVVVEAFPVPHGHWPNAWGYRFTTPDKVIVISGDTAPSEKLMEYASGADMLIHEVYYRKTYKQKSEFWQQYHAENHTSTFELAEIANEAEPKLLVLYHLLLWGGSREGLLEEIKSKYSGEVIAAQDLDVF